ncbi:MAG TPA: SMP-30/gluconolactonase/LRE family protein [Bryobacteraceae bacterium]
MREIDAATGILQTIAGSTCGFSGDGGPPLAASLTPSGVLAAPNGNVIYVSDAVGRIRQINLSSNQIVTYAGVGTAGISSYGAPATQTQLEDPGSMAFAADGSLLVAQTFGVLRIAANGVVSNFAGIDPEAGDGGTAPNAILAYPGYLAPDGKGGFVFNDGANGRIRAVTSAGVISTVAGINEFTGASGDGGLAKNAGIAFVRGLTVDAAGNIYIAQGAFATPSTFELRRITPAGTINEFGNSTFALPTGLAVDPTQQFLYMTEANGNRVVKIDLSNGNATTFAGQGAPGTTGTAGFAGDGGPAANAQFSTPGQIAVDAAGNVYVVDGGNSRIRRISASGSLIQTIAGNGTYASTGDGGPATSASIAVFVGMTVDSAGNVLFSEGAKIRRVDAVSGIVNTVAGGSIGGFAGDGGPALSARFADAEGMNSDSLGNVYFADALNHRIRLLSPPDATPLITSVDTAGGFPDIAQNAWIQIRGANLAPSSVGAGITWSSAPEFALGMMPTQLSGVSVKVNGNPAFIYYVSATQINVLTPLDSTLGPVQIVVTNGSNSSAPFTATLRAAAPSFLLFGATQYDAAIHISGALLGPVSLSVPGYSFTPAQKGETVSLYATGFGLPVTALVDGSSSQGGALPSLPTVLIGGLQATVEYAGVTNPGLYQLNVTVPANAVSGDNSLTVSYSGLTSPLGILLAVQ